jgi:hypothetical protein
MMTNELTRRPRYPVPDQCRCETLAKAGSWMPERWNSDVHRCGLTGLRYRDGRGVCHVHYEQPNVKYAVAIGSVERYRTTMA